MLDTYLLTIAMLNMCCAKHIDADYFRASKTLQNVRKTSFLCRDNYTLSVEDQKRKNHIFSKKHSSLSNFSTKTMDFACKSSQNEVLCQTSRALERWGLLQSFGGSSML